jgi:drug/metabolite transporter (DMT)-like permease
MEKTNHNTMKWILIAGLAVIWGSSFILMKKALVDFSPGQVASLRMFSSFLFLLPFVWHRLKEIKTEQWKFMAGTGMLGNGIPAFLFAFAQTKIPSFMAGMLNSLTPVFTLAIGYFMFKTQVTFARFLGVAIGLAGAVWLVGMTTTTGDLSEVSWYPILIVIATLCYAFSVNIIKHKLQEADSLMIAAGALISIGPITGIYLFSTDFLNRVETIPGAWISLIYVLILALLGTTFSLVIFNNLIKIAGALFASSVTYLIPIVAMLWGLADGEVMGVWHLAALGAILVGVYLINKSPVASRK